MMSRLVDLIVCSCVLILGGSWLCCSVLVRLGLICVSLMSCVLILVCLLIVVVIVWMRVVVLFGLCRDFDMVMMWNGVVMVLMVFMMMFCVVCGDMGCYVSGEWRLVDFVWV